MRTASWLLLALVAVLVLLGSSASIGVAYFAEGSSDIIAGETTLDDLGLSETNALALRGRRGTAGAFGLAFATLLLLVVLIPYRRGDRWAWWSILGATAVLAVGIGLRSPALGSSQGAATGLIIFIVCLVALLLDVRRLKSPA